MNKKSFETNEDGEVAGVIPVDFEIQKFIEETCCPQEQVKLLQLYQRDFLFRKQIDDEYKHSEFCNELTKKGYQAYDFLSSVLKPYEEIPFSLDQKQKIWNVIAQNISQKS